MDAQDVHEIGGFEDGKGEKLDIKKNNQNQPRNDAYSKNYGFNTTESLFSAAKVFGYFVLLGLFVFSGLSIGIDYRFLIGAGVCFIVLIFCIFASNASDKQRVDNMTYIRGRADDDIKNGVYRQNNIEQDNISDKTKNRKNVVMGGKEQFYQALEPTYLNNCAEYDKNNYDCVGENNITKF